MSGLLRKSHFLGAKIRNLRKRNGLTLQDVSARKQAENARAVLADRHLDMDIVDF